MAWLAIIFIFKIIAFSLFSVYMIDYITSSKVDTAIGITILYSVMIMTTIYYLMTRNNFASGVAANSASGLTSPIGIMTGLG